MNTQAFELFFSLLTLVTLVATLSRDRDQARRTER